MEPTDVRRIAFVTRRFHELQGLGRMGYAVYLPLLVWSGVTVDLQILSGETLAWFASLALVPAAISYGADKYYSTRLGRVANPRHALWPGLALSLCLLAALTVDIRYAASGRPSIAALLLASVALFQVVRDWPWRPQALVDVSACIAASLLWAHPPLPQYSALLALCVATVGQGVTGFLDHHLLTRTLLSTPGPGPAVSAEAPDGC